MNTAAAAAPEQRLIDYAPGLGAGLSYSAADVLSKVVFASGMDVLSLIAVRGILVTIGFWLWLRAVPPRMPHSPRARAISIGLGLLFAGNIFGLMYAIRVLPLSIAILVYFTYPLLTGIVSATIGLERIGWRSFAIALTAFGGLALMLNAQPGILSVLGLIAAFLASLSRVIGLVVTRAALNGTDARLTTWYSLAPSSVVFAVALLMRGSVHLPLTSAGWAGFFGMGLATTFATLWIYVSTARIGAFRTALAMNLEPVLSSLLSFALLGEAVTSLQLLGGAVMVAALSCFSLSRQPAPVR